MSEWIAIYGCCLFAPAGSGSKCGNPRDYMITKTIEGRYFASRVVFTKAREISWFALGSEMDSYILVPVVLRRAPFTLR